MAIDKIFEGIMIAISLFSEGLYHPVEFKSVDMTRDAKKGEVALVADDSKATQDRIGNYLGERGYEVIKTYRVDGAKSYLRSNPDITLVITDMDFSGAPYNYGIYDKIGGYRLVSWINDKQKNGEFQNLESVKLHLTGTNFGDKSGALFNPLWRFVRYKMAFMDERVENTEYGMQQKDAILDNEK